MEARLRTINWPKALATLLFAIVGLLFIMPFLWMISASFKIEADVLKFPIEWIPATWNAIENYSEVWFGSKPFALYYWNSIQVAILTTFGSVTFSCLAAYAFAKISFKGRDLLFLVVLATYMIPPQAIIIPQYLIYSSNGYRYASGIDSAQLL